MSRTIPMIAIAFTCLGVLQSPASGTTCVALMKTIKVKEVCGKITNPLNEAVAAVEVDLLDSKSELVERVVSDDNGDFRIPNARKGRYKIQVQRKGYAPALQEVVITKERPSGRCRKPLQARLQLVGCSSVSK